MSPTNYNPSSIKITYFDIEGVAEPVRLALLLARAPFEDVRIKFPEWQELKPKTPYGQLPVMTIDDDDDDMKTQSGAMLRYCSKVYENGPYGSLYPPDRMYEIEEVIGIITDMNNAFTPALYIANRPEMFGYPEGSQSTEEGKLRIQALRTAFANTILPKFLDIIDKLLLKSAASTNNDTACWLVPGDTPTIADCFAVPNLRRFSRGFIDHVPANCLESHPRVVQYLERFCALDELKNRYTDGIGGTNAAAADKEE